MMYRIKNGINLIKRFSKEITIALIFAVVAAVSYEYAIDKIKEHNLNSNKKAVAKILAFDKEGNLRSQGSGVFISNSRRTIKNIIIH
jgi:hypothetical protein